MLFPLLFATLLHPVHETVSEVQWNAETHRVEVALRMSVLDEQWVMQNHGNKDDDVKTWATKYLSRTFVVDPPKDKDAKQATYHWVGRKDEGAHVWWFFEIESATKKKPLELSQRMFFERDQGYANRVLLLGTPVAKNGQQKNVTVPRRSITLTIQQPTAKLDVDANDESKLNES
ncbi:MAG: DUF6702 family protein [Pirellulaceae bacterium]